jgi:non-specific serine/threonine protein kinase
MAKRAPGPSAGDHNLPIPLTTLVGRSEALSGIGEAIRRTRLVTVSGPGGVGKTRLALEVAHGYAGRRVDDVWLVELGADPGTPDVAAETARALGIVPAPGESAVDAVRRSLAGRELMIVLDNCEHVLEASAALVTDLLSSCAELRILATSRESLGVNGETVWRLGPLGQDDAYRLFVERARQRRPDLVPTAEDEATIGELCDRLDCLPFAIELAAARITAMSPAELLAALDARLGVLEEGGSRTPAHHRTVRAAVEWSYELLSPGEAQALLPLAVFAGGFDADAAAAVAPGLTLDLLARLVDKSLVSVTRSRRGKTRYRLLETVRDYASKLLGGSSGHDDARERHFRHFAALADVARDEWLTTGRQRFVNELDEDYENVRAALEWAVVADPCAGVRALVGTRDLFQRFGQRDGWRLARVLLERCPHMDRHRVEAQIAAGQLLTTMGDVDAARHVLAEARSLNAQLGEPVLEAWTRFFQGLTETLAGSHEPGRQHLEAARSLHRELGLRTGEGRSTMALAMSYLTEEESERGRELLSDALTLYVADDDRWGQGTVHTFLGVLSDAVDPQGATKHYRRAVELLRPYSDTTILPIALVAQAGVLGRRDSSNGLRVAAAGYAIRARVGGDFPPLHRARADRVRATLEQAVGDEADRVWAQGWRLGMDDAIALAFGSAKPRPTGPTGLSARELEVVRLVSDGLSNKAVAARLHLSVRTVESHVRHALAKLRLDNRTQLATWAREHVR